MKKAFIYITILLLLLSNTAAAKTNEKDIKIVYFYSSTCGACRHLNTYLDGIEQRLNNVSLTRYNILDLKNKTLMNKYQSTFKVAEKDLGIVPIIFLKESYLSGERQIKSKLEGLINKPDGLRTLEVNRESKNGNLDLKEFMNFKTITVISAGLINGLNPCSLSMLLFLISLLLAKDINIMKMGGAFCAGKLIAFLLLGTILFQVLSRIDTSWVNGTTKILTLLMVFILMVFNLKDFFAAKQQKYNKIKVQLPKIFRKFNHQIMESFLNKVNIRFLVLVCFVLGIVVAFGEFLCTGQIYLSTIVTVLQTNNGLTPKAFTYLLLYDIAFIIPLFLLTYAIYKGKAVFDLTEVIRVRLHLIKIINFAIFVIFAILIMVLL